MIPTTGENPRTWRIPWSRLALGAAALAILVLLGRRLGEHIPDVAGRIDRLGAWGPVAFIGAYTVANLLLIPGSLMTIAGGAMFGLARGSVIVFSAATLGAIAPFLIARHVARGAVQRRLGSRAGVRAIDQAVARGGFRLVLLLRLSPAIPYTLLNYTLGLTQVRFRHYLLASIGMLPGTVLYVYYGKLAGDVAALATGVSTPRGTGSWLVLGAGLVATLAAAVVITRLARRALDEATGEAANRAP